MKRILRAAIFGVAVSIFFTGCGSSTLINGENSAYEEAAQNYMETEPNETLRAKWGEAGTKAGETFTIETHDESYYESYYDEKNKVEKEQNLSGPMAFRIKDGHSKDTDDIESFTVEELRSDGTFLYYYTTRAENNEKKKVHCAATYNYNTEKFSVFHETVFYEQTSESFFMQVCDSANRDIFIYDNGVGYLYTSDGKLKLEMKIQEFIEQNFKGFSVSATSAMTNGDNRIYVNLFIETEDVSNMKEEKELEGKTLEAVLVYDLQTCNSTINQVNKKFDDQGDEWEDMNDDKSFDTLPNEETDWKTVLQKIPSQWGTAFLDDMKGDPKIYQWNSSVRFGYQTDGYISDFTPVKDTFKEFSGLRNGMNLGSENLFIWKDKHYYKLYGQVGYDLTDDGNYEYETFKRTVEQNTTDAEGNQTTEKKEQTITKGEKRKTKPTGSYLEGYWIEEDCDDVLNILDSTLFFEYDEKLIWYNTAGKQQSLDLGKIKEAENPENLDDFELMVNIVKDKGTLYIIVALENRTDLYRLNASRELEGDPKKIYNDQIRDVVKTVKYSQSSVDSRYHAAHASMSDNKDKNAGMLLDGKNILHVSLSDRLISTLKKIEDNKNIAITDQSLSKAGGNGYLVASMISGLVYLDDTSGKAVSLDEGTWYSVWRKGDSFVAVGFNNSTASYNMMDIVNARVKEFKLDDLYRSGLDAILASAENLKEKEEMGEGAKQMQQQYDETTKDKTLEFVEPTNNGETGNDVLEAWGNNKPGEVIKKKQEEREQSEAASRAAEEQSKAASKAAKEQSEAASRAE